MTGIRANMSNYNEMRIDDYSEKIHNKIDFIKACIAV